MSLPTPGQIRAAHRLLKGVVSTTPLEASPRLSAKHQTSVYLKREDLQPVRSYKLRGAYHHIHSLTAAVRSRGVVCASAGNHAQGVAFAARALEIPAIVFVPRNTPRQKLARIREVGSADLELNLAGDTYDESAALAAVHADIHNLALVPPFDDRSVITGQATVGLEIETQLGHAPELVVTPVGGGGLAAGLALALRDSRIAGAEPLGAASMAAAIMNGAPVHLHTIDTFVDGAAVGRVGVLPFEILRERLASLVAVDPGHLCTTMLELYQGEGIIAEPAGALSVAALGPVLAETPAEEVVCIISGGNNDVSRYAEIQERSLVARGLKHYFVVEFPQRPGALRTFLDDILGPNDDITLFEYVKKSNRESGPALVGLELAQPEDLEPLLVRLSNSGLVCERIDTTSPLFRFVA
ncbi:MAG: threonine ammonia-lyase IlvA [Candidatus Dormibacteria bacterium]